MKTLFPLFLLAAISVSHADDYVAVGGFASIGNAERLKREVAGKGYQTEISVIERSGSPYYRVLVRADDLAGTKSALTQDGYSGVFRVSHEPLAAVAVPEEASVEVAAVEPQVVEAASIKSVEEAIGIPEPAGEGLDQQQIKGHLDGIPMHYIDVQTFSHTDVAIDLDGIVDEAVWSRVPYFDNMIVAVPGTGEPGEYPTEIRILATEKGLFVSGVMHQPPETLARRLTNRDEFIDRDTFGFTLDTTGQGTFAYWFIVALGDSVMDGKVLPERRYTNDWDGPWIGKSSETGNGWSVEIFLPWSMVNLADEKDARNIGFAVSRQVSHANERYQWPGHSYSSPQFVTALNSMRVSGVDARQQVSLIPYASSTFDDARDDDETRVGADFTWKPSTRAEMSGTIYPDFGAVEADDVVLNLTAFEVFFPEKRIFFLEGNEVFVTTPRANSGNPLRELTNENFATTSRRTFVTDFLPPPISLINTRRIGGTATQIELPDDFVPNRGERDLPTDLLGALKVTGTLGNVRYGVLGALEDDIEWLGTSTGGAETELEYEGRDFGVVRLSYEINEEDRYALGYLGTMVDGPLYDAEVHGVDLHYGAGDGKWVADLQLIHSDVDDVSGSAGILDMTYASNSAVQHKLELDYFDEEVDINDLGFLRRNNYGGIQYVFRYADPSMDGFVQSTRGAITIRQQYNISKGQIVDSGIYWRNTAVLPGRNTVRTAIAYLPERYEDVNSRGNGAYKAEDRIWWNVLWTTDASRMFSWAFGAGQIQEDLGDWTWQLQAGVTVRPSDNFNVKLDVKYKRRDGWLVYQGSNNFGAFDGIDWQPSFDMNWFIVPGHQVRFSLQWAGVRMDEDGFYAVPVGDGELIPVPTVLPDHDFTVSLMTAQIRYRWEIAPLTDLFVVYNRGNRLPFRHEDEFSDLFEDVFDEPLVDSFIIKLRYRFGN